MGHNNSISHVIKKSLRKVGLDVIRYRPSSHPVARRVQLFSNYRVDVVLDVGANTGQFAEQLREMGYRGPIISFEPVSASFRKLAEYANHDASWKVLNFALGDKDEEQVINIAGNSLSSSILGMLPSHSDVAPDSSYVSKETITVRRLDSVFHELCSSKDNVYLKIDTQGYESKVIEGAEKVLSNIKTIQLEMSLTPLYEGELLFDELNAMLLAKGYTLVSIEPVFVNNETGQLLQVDGIYHRYFDSNSH